MHDYNKLSKKQLVALLERIERRLDGCIEEAESSAITDARKEDKYPFISGWMKGTIRRVLDDLNAAV